MKTTSVTLAAFASFAVLLGGCASDPAKTGSADDVKKMEQTFQSDVTVGMSIDQIRSELKQGNLVRLTSTMANGATIEEWKYEVYHDDTWNKTRDQYVSFLYAVNGTVKHIARQRVNFDSNPELIKQWTSGGNAKPAAAKPAPPADDA